MKSYLAAVRHGQIAIGLGDPVLVGMPQLQYVLKGARQNLAGRPGRTRLPITPEIFRQLRCSWERHPSRVDAVMLWAAATLCFFAFVCMGEEVVPSDSGFDTISHMVTTALVSLDFYAIPIFPFYLSPPIFKLI